MLSFVCYDIPNKTTKLNALSQSTMHSKGVIMKLAKALLTALVISSTSLVAINAHADDYLEFQTRQDVNFEKNVQKAIAILTKKGYQVDTNSIDVDERWGKPVLEIEAYKGAVKYDITMSYPDLNILKTKRDWD